MTVHHRRTLDRAEAGGVAVEIEHGPSIAPPDMPFRGAVRSDRNDVAVRGADARLNDPSKCSVKTGSFPATSAPMRYFERAPCYRRPSRWALETQALCAEDGGYCGPVSKENLKRSHSHSSR